MNNPIDKLFNSKLTGHAMNPSPMAWDKIDASISKKNKGLVWPRVAAILLIGVFISTILWFQSHKSNSASNSLTQTETTNKSEQATKDLQTNQSQQTEVSSIDSKNTRINTKRKSKLIEKSIPIIETQKEEPVTVATQQPDNSLVISTINSVAENKVVTRRPIILEYRLDDIAATAPGQEKTEFVSIEQKNGFKKAIDYAIGVKNGDSTLFSLRQAKENLFALNFKKDKKNITNQ